MQNNKLSPSYIARETLKQLSQLKTPPTPDNYYKLYEQISGTPDNHMSDITVKLLIELAKDLPRHTPHLLHLANALDQTIKERNWLKFKSVFVNYFTVDTKPINAEKPQKPIVSVDTSWSDTVGALCKHFMARQDTSIIKNKFHNVNLLLNKFSADSEQLHHELNALIGSWNTPSPCTTADQPEDTVSTTESIDACPPISDSNQPDSEQPCIPKNYSNQVSELLIQLLEHIASIYIADETLYDGATTLAKQVQHIQKKEEITQFTDSFKQFCMKFETSGEDNIRLQQELLRLFNFLIDSTGNLLPEDRQMKQQVDKLKAIMSKPLNIDSITRAERYLEGIVHRQKTITQHLGETRVTLKQMVASLIQNLEDVSGSTGKYQDKLAYFSEKTSHIDNIDQLNQLILEIVQETNTIKNSVSQYHDELLSAHSEINLAQEQISQLETKLQEMDQRVNEDHLTGILNRRGLDNAFEREILRSKRKKTPLCLALLDIDNFKQLNDTHGHQAGDYALIYFAEAIKETIRSDDIVSRYGGEEFAILLPNTKLDTGLSIATRILRSLTKKFFMHENKRLLITFSGGIAQFQLDESKDSILKRADNALYQAKRNGKNQIFTAE